MGTVRTVRRVACRTMCRRRLGKCERESLAALVSDLAMAELKVSEAAGADERTEGRRRRRAESRVAPKAQLR